MELTRSNPYRILGILAGTKARDQDRQIRRLRQYLDVGQEPEEDFSFPALGKIERSVAGVDEATSQLNLDQGKVMAALFWFCNGNFVRDEAAFECLKVGDFESAEAIWRKLLASGEIEERNWSAYQNLSTLLLQPQATFAAVEPTRLKEGLSLKLELLESSYAQRFVEFVAGETYKPSKTALQLMFLEAIREEVLAAKFPSLESFGKLVSGLDFSTKAEFLKRLVKKPIEEIENLVEITAKKRQASPRDAVLAGDSLLWQVSSSIRLVREILGSGDLTYSSIADKVSNEALQCSIDYFNHYQDSDSDPGPMAYKLASDAAKFAVGVMIRDRCDETLEVFEDWNASKAEREKDKLIGADLTAIMAILQKYEELPSTIKNGVALINECKPKLQALAVKLSKTNELYLKASTRVASDAQANIISEVNEGQERFAGKWSHKWPAELSTAPLVLLRMLIKSAVDATELLGTLDMEADFRNKSYLPNKKVINEIHSQFDETPAATPKRTPSPTSGVNSAAPKKAIPGNDGCTLAGITIAGSAVLGTVLGSLNDAPLVGLGIGVVGGLFIYIKLAEK